MVLRFIYKRYTPVGTKDLAKLERDRASGKCDVLLNLIYRKEDYFRNYGMMCL
ncbi:hypothetical protein ACFL4Z_00855 [candidate division KSB1 bacterium]